MSVFLQPIYTQTVGSGGVSSVTFNNIPQTFTDLKVLGSFRTDRNAADDNIGLRFNSDAGANYSSRFVYGTGSGAGSIPVSYISPWDASAAQNTSNTFANGETYIANYTNSNFKQVIGDSVSENNASTAYQFLSAGLWRSTAAITSLTILSANGANLVQYSTFTLYGITKG